MKANVICCNDDIKVAVLGSDDTKAFEKMEEMSKAHYECCKQIYKTYEEYTNIMYWHLHEVEMIG